jgi:hypothetical protein
LFQVETAVSEATPDVLATLKVEEKPVVEVTTPEPVTAPVEAPKPEEEPTSSKSKKSSKQEKKLRKKNSMMPSEPTPSTTVEAQPMSPVPNEPIVVETPPSEVVPPIEPTTVTDEPMKRNEEVEGARYLILTILTDYLFILQTCRSECGDSKG